MSDGEFLAATFSAIVVIAFVGFVSYLLGSAIGSAKYDQPVPTKWETFKVHCVDQGGIVKTVNDEQDCFKGNVIVMHFGG
jgi:hypothetical protein